MSGGGQPGRTLALHRWRSWLELPDASLTVGFPESGWAEQDHVVGLRDERGGGQVGEHVAAQGWAGARG